MLYPGKPYFDKILWNQYDNDKRTNNDVEGYNYKLTTVLKVHPNIWIFITKIKSEESAGTSTIIYHYPLYSIDIRIDCFYVRRFF